jgi:hypothetical protein
MALVKYGHYKDIQKSCAGIIFLATPHRGSKEVGFPSLIANIANIATVGLSRFVGRARTDLVDALKRDANVLEQISIEFADEPLNIKIASFIEQNITPPAKNRASR